jgi:hypothetical protein
LNDFNDFGTVEPLVPNQDIYDQTDHSQRLPAMPSQPFDFRFTAGLFPDQQRAFGILKWHLAKTLYAEEHDPSQKPPQLRMLLIGEGGTGKSRVIQETTQEFRRLGIENRLMKAAFTGERFDLLHLI